MAQILHICVICCRQEATYDVISGLNVKTIEGYLLVNSEVAALLVNLGLVSEIFKANRFVTTEADIDDRRTSTTRNA